MMTVVTETGFTLSVPAPAQDSRTPRLATWWLDTAIAVIAAEGEIDAANADALGDYAAGVALRARDLVIDLSRLEFFGIEGFSVLRMVEVQCAGRGVHWVVVPGPAVARVLRQCDPKGVLTTAGTVDAALAALRGRRRLSLVSQ